MTNRRDFLKSIGLMGLSAILPAGTLLDSAELKELGSRAELGGRFAFDIARISIGFDAAVGPDLELALDRGLSALATALQLSYTQPLTRLISGPRTYYSAGRPQGNLWISRMLCPEVAIKPMTDILKKTTFNVSTEPDKFVLKLSYVVCTEMRQIGRSGDLMLLEDVNFMFAKLDVQGGSISDQADRPQEVQPIRSYEAVPIHVPKPRPARKVRI